MEFKFASPLTVSRTAWRLVIWKHVIADVLILFAFRSTSNYSAWKDAWVCHGLSENRVSLIRHQFSPLWIAMWGVYPILTPNMDWKCWTRRFWRKWSCLSTPFHGLNLLVPISCPRIYICIIYIYIYKCNFHILRQLQIILLVIVLFNIQIYHIH